VTPVSEGSLLLLPALPLVATLVCTLFWGVAGGTIAGISMNPATLTLITCLVQGPVMLMIAARQGLPRRDHVQLRSLLLIGAAGAVVSFTFFASLGMAPPAIASALHLCAPVLLVVLGLGRRRRRLDMATLLVLGLLLAGSASGVAGGGLGTVTPHVLLGIGLALVSAAAIAFRATLINRHGCGAGAAFNSGVATMVCAVPFVPFLFTNPPSLHELVVLSVVTLTCYVPAGLMAWWAAPKLDPTLTTAIGLNEALVTASLAWVVLGAHLSPLQLAGGVAILAAVVLEARRHTAIARRRASVPHAGRDRRDDGHQLVPHRAPRQRMARRYRAATRPVRARARARRLARAEA
jgi:drug/metabolite transporter (DMT)-like permease